MKMTHDLRSHHQTRTFSPVAPRRQSPRTAYLPRLDRLEDRIALSSISISIPHLVVEVRGLPPHIQVQVPAVKAPVRITTVTINGQTHQINTGQLAGAIAQAGRSSSTSITSIQTQTSNGSESISKVNVEEVQSD
jgi:hypothetical protein